MCYSDPAHFPFQLDIFMRQGLAPRYHSFRDTNTEWSVFSLSSFRRVCSGPWYVVNGATEWVWSYHAVNGREWRWSGGINTAREGVGGSGCGYGLCLVGWVECVFWLDFKGVCLINTYFFLTLSTSWGLWEEIQSLIMTSGLEIFVLWTIFSW